MTSSDPNTLYPSLPTNDQPDNFERYFKLEDEQREEKLTNMTDKSFEEPKKPETIIDTVKSTVASIATKENAELLQHKAGEALETVKSAVAAVATKENMDYAKEKAVEAYDTTKSAIAKVATKENADYVKAKAWDYWSWGKDYVSSFTTPSDKK
ncbi:DHX58 [Acrasis kona]|uniref:DHX58 n=1 Tax=Acrasis kona TaxID=1008807 RepID=A0AAW2ZD38_9EUKA